MFSNFKQKIFNMPGISQQIKKISQNFIDLYISSLASTEGKKKLADLLREVFQFQNDESKFGYHKKRSAEDVKKFIAHKILGKENDYLNLADIKNKKLIELMGHYAKINDILRRIRVISNQQYFDQNFHSTVADAPEYVFSSFYKQKVPERDVQKYLDQILVSTATTSHPTNANSTNYTKIAMALAEEIAEYSPENHQKLSALMEQIIQEPIFGARRTQEVEVEEGLLYLDAIYNAVPDTLQDFREAIASSEYKGIELPKQLFDFNVWITGDGDGNPNSTEESLAGNITSFKKAIKEKYKSDLNKIPDIDKEMRDDLLKFLENPYNDIEDFIQKLDDKRFLLQSEETAKIINETIERAHIFGFHYAKIEIRHESSDIMKTLAAILHKVKAVDSDNPEKLTSEKILECLNNPQILAAIKNLDYRNENFGQNDELTKRIFGRFKLVAANPEMFDKVIIAEFKDKINIHATLLLLSGAGNKMCEKGANINIVPLAEEFKTLRELPKSIADSLDDPTYFSHIQATKKLYFMIAKSDTVRRGGVGAQESQETAVKESIKAIIKKLIDKGITNLEEYEIIPYNGGGHALQRGGGRMTELPSVYGRYALRAIQELREEFLADPLYISKVDEIDKVRIVAPEFTVQGHQNYILFAPKNVGNGTLKALLSQAFYANARLDEVIADHEVETNGHDMSIEEKVAFRKKAKIEKDYVCEKAMKVYEQVLDAKGPINRLFKNACWLSTKANNKSSRASVRGFADAAPELKTLEQVMGKREKNILLDQRAIGAEKLCAHSGTNLISWFGWADGLQAAKHENVMTLNEIYRGSKSFRDYMRSAALSLYMTDFSVSWNMMIGRERPEIEELEELLDSYNEKISAGQSDLITNEETLAFVESEAFRTMKLVGEAIYGRTIERGEELLSKWPDVKEEIDYRKQNCVFAHAMQSVITNISHANPKEIFDEDLEAATSVAFCAVEPSINTPIGVQSVLTKERVESPKIGAPVKHDVPEIPLVDVMETILTSSKRTTNMVASAGGSSLQKRRRMLDGDGNESEDSGRE